MSKKEEKKKSTPKGKIESSETVEVSKSALDNLILEVKDLRARVDATADLSRLESFDRKHQKKGPNRFRLTVVETEKGDRVVVGWRTVKDVSKKDPVRGMIEDQQYEVKLQTGEVIPVSGYKAFSDLRYEKTIWGEEIERKTDKNGTVLTLRLPDGEEIAIDSRFVN